LRSWFRSCMKSTSHTGKCAPILSHMYYVKWSYSYGFFHNNIKKVMIHNQTFHNVGFTIWSEILCWEGNYVIRNKTKDVFVWSPTIPTAKWAAIPSFNVNSQLSVCMAKLNESCYLRFFSGYPLKNHIRSCFLLLALFIVGLHVTNVVAIYVTAILGISSKCMSAQMFHEYFPTRLLTKDHLTMLTCGIMTLGSLTHPITQHL